MGLSPLTLDKGTKIEIPIKDVHGKIFRIAGQVTSVQTDSLIFKVQFPGCLSRKGDWSQTRSRADMESTWRLPNAWERQPPVQMALQTQGFTPWHHPLHGSHWLRLQPRGAWYYGKRTADSDRHLRNIMATAGGGLRLRTWKRAISQVRRSSQLHQPSKNTFPRRT